MKRILITGGTGSFGQALIRRLLSSGQPPERLVVFSRDELKQYEMAKTYSPPQHPSVRFFLGDVRDRARLRRALEGIEIVVHAAALKQVPAAEYNPMEFIHTNVLGAGNVIEACVDAGVRRVVALSTDKAAAPINLYGATKLCSDKLFIAANNYVGRATVFSVVRYGNVMGSRGSVIPFFLEKAKTGELPITDPAMTRFNITLEEGVSMVLWALREALGGEVFVPKIPSYRITDLARAIGPSCQQKTIGIRPGEKVHEEMITPSDSLNTVDLGDYYAILNTGAGHSVVEYLEKKKGKKVKEEFSYNSGKNEKFLSVPEIQNLIRSHLDPRFQPV
jgi:UDP-N-acetylglucosamine 4,6-dehydratase (inverting)